MESNGANSKQSEVDILTEAADPEGVVTLSDGREIRARKCTVRSMGQIADALGIIFSVLGVRSVSSVVEGEVSFNPDDPNLYFDLFSRTQEELRTIVSSLCYDLTSDEFAELPLDDAIMVLDAVWRLNHDFFLRRVVPALTAVLPAGVLQKAERAAGK